MISSNNVQSIQDLIQKCFESFHGRFVEGTLLGIFVFFVKSQLAYGAGGGGPGGVGGRPYSSLAMRDYEMGGQQGGALVGLDGLHTDNSRSYLGGAGSRLSGASDPTGMSTGGGGGGLVSGMGGLNLNSVAAASGADQAVIGGSVAGEADRNRFLASRRFVGAYVGC